LARATFWGESDYKDLEKFPARAIHNAPPTYRFDELPADNPYISQIEAIGNRSSNGSLIRVPRLERDDGVSCHPRR
jgi:hypothetical protein